MIICLTLLCGYAKAQTRGGDSSPPMPKEISAELFDKAVALIKEFEGWHSAKHYPYIGYGHKLLPHENLTADITEEQADSLLRADLLERYKYFRQYGKDALLLSEISDKSKLSFPNCRNIAQNFRKSFRKSASACRFVMVRAEYLSPGNNLCPYPTYGWCFSECQPSKYFVHRTALSNGGSR